MAVIEPKGMYSGDRMMRLSTLARLHWPYLFLLCNGYGRFEVNYRKIIWNAYQGFQDVPSQADIYRYIQEYALAHLLFLYKVNGAIWAQWDVPARLLPKYQTKEDERSPAPPTSEYQAWIEEYLRSKENEGTSPPSEIKALGNLPVNLLENRYPNSYGIGIGEGIGIGVLKTSSPAAPDEVLVYSHKLETQQPPTPGNAPKTAALFTGEPIEPPARTLESLQREWFEKEFWPAYWRRVDKADALKSFKKHAVDLAAKNLIVKAVREQSAYYLARDHNHRPHAATWLNKLRFNDSSEEYQIQSDDLAELIANA